MLAGHPDLFCPPELHLLQFDNMKERQQSLGNSYLTEGLDRALLDIGDRDAHPVQTIAQNWVEQEAPVTQVYKWMQDAVSPRILIDKSPTYGSEYETLLCAETYFENPKYIHLVRHPYSVIESFVRNRMEKLGGIETRNPSRFAEQVWCETNANILDLSLIHI